MKSEQYTVFQSNAISRACYKCTPLERQLLFFATTQIKKKSSFYYADFSVSQCIKLFFDDTPLPTYKARQEIKNAIERLFQKHNAITIFNDSNKFIAVSWLQKVDINLKNDSIHFFFTNEIGKRLHNLKSNFTKVDLQIIANLKSYYSIRLFEILLSYKGFEGRGFNRFNEWYFELTVDDVKRFFDLSEKYITKKITTQIIKPAIAEIKAAAKGFLTLDLFVVPLRTDLRKIGCYHIACRENPELVPEKIGASTPHDLKMEHDPSLAPLDAAIEVMKTHYFNEYVQTAAQNPKQPYDSQLMYDAKILKILQKDGIFKNTQTA